MTRTRLLAALVAGLTVAGVGTAAAALADPAERRRAPSSGRRRLAARPPAPRPPTTDHRTAPAATGATAADGAGRIAVRHLGGGTVTKVERRGRARARRLGGRRAPRRHQ